MGCGFSKSKTLCPTIRTSDFTMSDNPCVVRSLSNLPITARTFISNKSNTIESVYSKISSIHSGSHSEIYKAYHKPTGQIRAVKVIHRPTSNNDRQYLDSSLKEREILKKLSHPNILKCYEILEDYSKYYIVTEYCEGGTLFDRLVKLKKFTEEEVAEIMLQLLSAVSYLHSSKVVNRDLRPENILLLNSNEKLEIKIESFSRASSFRAGMRLSGNYGVGYYVAPEVLSGYYNEGIDVWNCGIIMYIMLVGKSPYRCKTPEQLILNIKEGKVDMESLNKESMTSEALHLLNCLLEPDANKRISAKLAHTFPFIMNKKSSYQHPELNSAMNNMRNFKSKDKLQDAIYTFIASQNLDSQEIMAYQNAFKTLDTNNDGKLTADELITFLSKSLGKAKAIEEVNHIMKEVDCDMNKFIDYTEFLKASLGREKMISKQNLDIVFVAFDRDNKGSISADDLKEVLGQDIEVLDTVWKDMVQKVDINSDGRIDLNEFYSMLPGTNKSL